LQATAAVNAVSALLADENQEARVAACLALGAIASGPALEAMAGALTEGDEQVQRAAAEMFGAHVAEGYPVLYDAAHSEQLLLRRAAIFGLRRVETPWALIEIYRAFLEDVQWYVQSAAQEAFITAHRKLDTYRGGIFRAWMPFGNL